MPPPANTISFAPTVTPGTFFDPPEPVEPPPESLLFPPSPDVPATPPRRGGHTKKKPENHIPRPPNAFILFRSSFIKNQHVSCEVETNHSTLSKIIGLTWQNLPHDEKQIWHSRAKVALQEHKQKFPEYAFRPAHTKGTKGAKGGKGAEKRKVREVGPKDVKRCAKIAELLVGGKRGAELEAAIAEFDRSHVPEIVTRFEAPITARTYRRSSSVPVVPAPKSRKPRAASSQPAEPSTSGLSPDTWFKLPKISDADASSEYSLDYPSIPPSPCEPSADYAFPAPNPVFDFSAFDFAAAAATPVPEPVDPLSPGGHQGPPVAYDPFANYAQAAVAPNVAPTDDVFGPNLSLNINTSFYGTPANSYGDSPSPGSSMPTTPQTPHHLSYPMMYGSHAGVSSPGLDYSSSSPVPQYISPAPQYGSPVPPYISTPVPQYTSSSPVPGCSASPPVPTYNTSSPVPDYSSSSPAPYYSSASPAPYYGPSSPAPDYSPSYSYFPDVCSYSEHVAPTYAAASRPAEANPGYYTAAKPDFRYFDKPDVATYNSGLAPPFVPNYTM